MSGSSEPSLKMTPSRELFTSRVRKKSCNFRNASQKLALIASFLWDLIMTVFEELNAMSRVRNRRDWKYPAVRGVDHI